MIYLAAPFSHPDVTVRAARVEAATQAAAQLWDRGITVYSPITHGACIEAYLKGERSHDWWMRHCWPFLRRSDYMIVLDIEGWRESVGVTAEIKFCHSHGVKVVMHSERWGKQ